MPETLHLNLRRQFFADTNPSDEPPTRDQGRALHNNCYIVEDGNSTAIVLTAIGIPRIPVTLAGT